MSEHVPMPVDNPGADQACQDWGLVRPGRMRFGPIPRLRLAGTQFWSILTYPGAVMHVPPPPIPHRAVMDLTPGDST